eukprot:CAMPEP_0198210374 /NCGR_PEP_ID=MMETSP1445-20131203/20066_1 /TAXON_ID=36898 /ORGANISM="Pyramimonas sp., Strain CCMP2087" /LENGTH=531 /DNA_ID=CAMNT_0043884419 /DNA_START=380 /DNA_END=1972 /DNA_ORIENTATION=+
MPPNNMPPNNNNMFAPPLDEFNQGQSSPNYDQGINFAQYLLDLDEPSSKVSDSEDEFSDAEDEFYNDELNARQACDNDLASPRRQRRGTATWTQRPGKSPAKRQRYGKAATWTQRPGKASIVTPSTQRPGKASIVTPSAQRPSVNDDDDDNISMNSILDAELDSYGFFNDLEDRSFPESDVQSQATVDSVRHVRANTARWAKANPRAALPGLQPNTAKHTSWAMTAMNRFREDVHQDQTPFHSLSETQVADQVSSFASQMNRGNGTAYKVKTMKSMILGVQRYLNEQGQIKWDSTGVPQPKVALLSRRGPYARVYNALDNRMRAASQHSKLAKTTRQPRFTDVEKAAVRGLFIFQYDSPLCTSYAMSCAIHWIFGLELVLRGSDEHVSAKWSNFSLQHDHDGVEFVQYDFPPDKSTSGGIENSLDHAAATMYANQAFPAECPVRLWKELDRIRPANAVDRLYLGCKSQGSRKTGNFEYKKGFNCQPMGKITVSTLLPFVCDRAGCVSRSAHALRRTAISDMFQAGAPEPMI